MNYGWYDICVFIFVNVYILILYHWTVLTGILLSLEKRSKIITFNKMIYVCVTSTCLHLLLTTSELRPDSSGIGMLINVWTVCGAQMHDGKSWTNQYCPRLHHPGAADPASWGQAWSGTRGNPEVTAPAHSLRGSPESRSVPLWWEQTGGSWLSRPQRPHHRDDCSGCLPAGHS